ncbi:MAG: AraC family transcriptional regulator [Alphaproteobacteria bacterium]
MDLLSDVLQSLRIAAAIFLRGEFSSPWGVATPDTASVGRMLRPVARRLLVFHIVASGSCWIRLDNGTTARVEAPGVLLVPQGHAHLLADCEGRRCQRMTELLPPPPWTRFPVLSHGGGGSATRILCGYLDIANAACVPLLDELPDLIAIGATDRGPQAGLAPVLEYTVREAEAVKPGAASLVFRMAELFFVEVLRHYVATAPGGDRGWLAALRDPVVARALHLLHQDPARDWSVDTLAQAVASSRSALAGRFTARLGCSPMRYLTRWRVQLAAKQIADQGLCIAAAAAAVGYESESAFHRAFKREFGQTPAAWRRQGGAALPQPGG